MHSCRAIFPAFICFHILARLALAEMNQCNYNLSDVNLLASTSWFRFTNHVYEKPYEILILYCIRTITFFYLKEKVQLRSHSYNKLQKCVFACRTELVEWNLWWPNHGLRAENGLHDFEHYVPENRNLLFNILIDTLNGKYLNYL